MKDCSLFLLQCFILPHFIRGSVEVHILFDNPGRQLNYPKIIERQRRDVSSLPDDDHQHAIFSDIYFPPSKWSDHLSCSECKRNLVIYVGEYFKHNASKILKGEKKYFGWMFLR